MCEVSERDRERARQRERESPREREREGRETGRARDREGARERQRSDERETQGERERAREREREIERGRTLSLARRLRRWAMFSERSSCSRPDCHHAGRFRSPATKTIPPLHKNEIKFHGGGVIWGVANFTRAAPRGGGKRRAKRMGEFQRSNRQPATASEPPRHPPHSISTGSVQSVLSGGGGEGHIQQLDLPLLLVPHVPPHPPPLQPKRLNKPLARTGR